MKKLLIAFVIILFTGKISGQDSTFGLTAGYNNLISKSSFDGDKISNSETGFFVGFFTEFILSDFVSIQPQFNYSVIIIEDERLNELIIPIMFKYYTSDKFYLQAGPQFDYILDEDAEDVNKLGISLGLGIGFDITRDVFLSARYAFGLNNRIDLDAEDFFGEDIEIRNTFDNFQIGIGYRF